MAIFASEALVFGATPYSNTSLIVTLFTLEAGKVRVVAKGARAPKSRLGPTLEPLTHVEAEWSSREGAELGTLRKCESRALFRRLWKEPEAMALGYRLLQTMDRLFGIHEGEAAHFRLLLAALRAIEADGKNLASIEGVFFIMLLARVGLSPRLGYCDDCRKKAGAEAAVLDIAAGELRCRDCPRQVEQGMRLRPGAIATIGAALAQPEEKLAAIRILPSLQDEVIRAGRRFLAFHSGHPSLSFPGRDAPGSGD
ncbi:MAG: DNA repair protein RecO [bacterium]|nr:DNA repair protein RecO [bacterium]